MPRIRTLKPEHKQHRKVGMLTDRQYRLWVGMLTEADDDGRLVADPAQLRLQIFGYHPRVTTAHVADALLALATVGLIHIYAVDKVPYALFPSWRDHQRLDKHHYLPSRLPLNGDSTLHAIFPPVVSRESPSSLPVDSRETTGSQGTEGNLTTHGTEGRGVGRDPEPDVKLTLEDRKDQALDALARSAGITRDELKTQSAEYAKRSGQRKRP